MQISMDSQDDSDSPESIEDTSDSQGSIEEVPERWRYLELCCQICGVSFNIIEGYNGHRISADEMRACTTAQFLVSKRLLWDPVWHPDPDDEQFEGGEHFLSGLSDRVPEVNHRHRPDLWPRRQGIPHVPTSNYLWSRESADVVCMPFHPYCLEVYKRASLRRFDTLGIGPLTDWYRLENSIRGFFSFPRHLAVWRGRGDTWQHHSGDEWLAANPCFIPSLPPLLESCKFPETTVPDSPGNTRLNDSPPHNVFSRLPIELHLEILSYLGGLDVANLVQSSRTFWLLPPSFFYGRLLQEMPWLWEAWCDLPYSFWATTTSAEQEAVSRYWERQRSDLADWRIPVLPAYLLPKTEVDWRRLFISISRNLREIKGLRNRARIWADCEYILDRIE
ncbi:uncharacterized protein EI97DRAFT_405859, partial [Westerdykella ornata]